MADLEATGMYLAFVKLSCGISDLHGDRGALMQTAPPLSDSQGLVHRSVKQPAAPTGTLPCHLPRSPAA